jgi:dipeptidase E
MAPRSGEDFVGWKSPGRGDGTLSLLDFSIFPNLGHPDLPENTLADAQGWAAKLAGPAYAIDDQTALKVTEDGGDVVSERHWKFFSPTH